MFISFNKLYDGIKSLGSSAKDLEESSHLINMCKAFLFASALMVIIFVISIIVRHTKKIKDKDTDDTIAFGLIIFTAITIVLTILVCSFREDYLSDKARYDKENAYVAEVTQKNNVDADSLVENIEYLKSVYGEYSSKYENLENNVNGNCSGKVLNFDTSDKDFQNGIGLLKLGKYSCIDIVLNKFYNGVDILNYPELYDGETIKFTSYDDCISFRANAYRKIDNLEDVLNSSEFGYDTVVGNLKK